MFYLLRIIPSFLIGLLTYVALRKLEARGPRTKIIGAICVGLLFFTASTFVIVEQKISLFSSPEAGFRYKYPFSSTDRILKSNDCALIVFKSNNGQTMNYMVTYCKDGKWTMPCNDSFLVSLKSHSSYSIRRMRLNHYPADYIVITNQNIEQKEEILDLTDNRHSVFYVVQYNPLNGSYFFQDYYTITDSNEDYNIRINNTIYDLN